MAKPKLIGEDPFSVLCRACGGGIDLPETSRRGRLNCPTCGQGYPWDDGILVMGPSAGEDYPTEAHMLLAQVEPRHFWFTARNRLILSTMREMVGALRGCSVLDIGCGRGFVLAALERAGMVTVGLDVHLAGLRYARERARGILICDGSGRIPFSGQFDTAMLCDVIEHAEDDVALIRDARRALKEHGVLVITVPAHPSLWSALDEASGHKHRYTRRGLVDAMRRAGLRVHLVRSFNALLLPVQFLQRRLYRGRRLGDAVERTRLLEEALRPPPAPANAFLQLVMAADVLLSRLPVTFGASLIAVGSVDRGGGQARRPSYDDVRR